MGRPRSRNPVSLEALDAQARALAAGARFGQRLKDRQDADGRRAMQSQYRGIPPRWYQEIEEARTRRVSNL